MFLDQLLEPVNGFIILDLHNLWCQLHNFSIGFDELIQLYPLDKVREIHISGGSWDHSQIEKGRTIRRDTHDDAVPAAVFQLLETVIPACPNLKYVVLEQLGNGLESAESKQQFYADFLEMEKIIGQKSQPAYLTSLASFIPISPVTPGPMVEDEWLYRQQAELSTILESSLSYEDARLLLDRSSLANSMWKVENWDPAMIETAIKIAQKWKAGW